MTTKGFSQTPATTDPLAIGGKDTAWFMDRPGRPDTDSEPQDPFKVVGNVYYVGANNIASILSYPARAHSDRYRDREDGCGRVSQHREAGIQAR
jgi:hypothetical protein